ncbi:MAG: hydrogenase maturation nickel metallochaperone HypA [Actinomycetota bacterium]|nr:hydrogenase maturation nickel metallochaperone HypA [Actinomycetota bacterium]
MHELSYCEGVLEAVERRAAGRPVAAIGVRIGAVHRVVADAFQQSFSIAAMNGPAAQAETSLVVVPVSGHCMDCRNDFESDDPSPACPACGALDVAVDGGDDVVLEWLRYVDAAVQPQADQPPELVPAHSHVGDH